MIDHTSIDYLTGQQKDKLFEIAKEAFDLIKPEDDEDDEVRSERMVASIISNDETN
jgi:hypothetical protein